MPDYSACSQAICPNRHTCARYLMVPDEMGQWYTAFEPDNCEHYWFAGEVPFKMRSVEDANAAYIERGKDHDT